VYTQVLYSLTCFPLLLWKSVFMCE
jgi:hypothetical protein